MRRSSFPPGFTVSLTRHMLPVLAAAVFGLALQGPVFAQSPVALPFHEGFEDTDWAARGWYDNPAIECTAAQDAPEGAQVCAWHWDRAGAVLPGGKGGRVLLPPCEEITFSFSIRFSPDWTWTGRGWHPHMFMFMTDHNGAQDGPAWTHLTVYAEAVDGRLRFAVQDGQNIDTLHLRQDLSDVTEQRAVAGGNGPGDCYRAGTHYANGRAWDSDSLCLGDPAGPFCKSDWHRMKVQFRLNRVVDGKGVSDGQVRWWMDGRLVLTHDDLLFRTGARPQMKINQFLMLPYYGPGVPHEQSVWVDDLEIDGR